LKGLEPLDAEVLKLLSASDNQEVDNEQNGTNINAEKVAQLLGADTEGAQKAHAP